MGRKKNQNKAVKKAEPKKKVQQKKVVPQEVVVEEKQSKKPIKRKLVFGGVAIGMLTLIVGVYFGGKVMMSGVAFPNSSVAGISVGLMSRAEIKAVLKDKLFALAEKPIRVSDGQRSEDFSYVEMNVFADVNETIDKLSFVGEDGDDWGLIRSFFQGEEVLMEVDLQHDRSKELLGKAFGLDVRRAKNASFSLSEDGQFVIVKEKPGLKLDYEKFVEDLTALLCRFEKGEVELVFVPDHPTIGAAELQLQKEALEKKINQTVVLRHDKDKWEIPLKERLAWVSFAKKDEYRVEASTEPVVGIGFDIKLEAAAVKDYLAKEVAGKVERPVTGVKISRDEKGNVVFDGRPVNGKELEYEKAVEIMSVAINKGETEVELPIREVKASVETGEELKELGIDKLLATGYTTFYGSSSNRMHNIGVGVTRYNGLIVKPGESVSFNAHLGPVDGGAGYRRELVIKGDETIPEYGGGLCQVSTTFYRAALYAGLPIEKRSPHSYAVSYYAQVGGHGLDATIYPDAGKDIIFKNDTPGHILIQSYTDGAEAFFHFYGSDDGREVAMEGPFIGNYRGPGPTVIEETTSLAPGARKQVESAHTGFDTTWYRTIKKGGEEIREEITSNYRAVQAKILVGKSAAE